MLKGHTVQAMDQAETNTQPGRMLPLASAIAVGLGLMAGGTVPAIAATKAVALYATSAQDIRVVPLVEGGLPDLSSGTDIVASASCEDDLTQMPNLVSLHSTGEFLAVWWNETTDKACYSRFSPDGNGSFIEQFMGDWHGGATSGWSGNQTQGVVGNMWRPLPAADLNGDGLDDLVLFNQHRIANAHDHTSEYKVAFGQADGSFDFSGAATVFTDGVWSTYVTVGDTDGDDHADLVYFTFPTGGTHSSDIYVLKGQGDGSFASTADRQLLVSTGSGRGGNTPAIGDLNADSYPDLFIGPDDDVEDEGQALIAFGTGNGAFAPVTESIDFVPSKEGWSHDTFSASAAIFDVNLDGHPDIVANASQWNVSTTKQVHWGDGTGQFSNTGEELFSIPAGTPYPRLAWLTVPEDAKCEGHAHYDVETGILNLPMVDMATIPALGGFGRAITSVIGTVEVDLSLIPGSNLFEIKQVLEATPADTDTLTVPPCHAEYRLESQYLTVPKVDLDVVTVINGIPVKLGTDTLACELEMPVGSDLFKVKTCGSVQ